jgi:hypothetical protein
MLSLSLSPKMEKENKPKKRLPLFHRRRTMKNENIAFMKIDSTEGGG